MNNWTNSTIFVYISVDSLRAEQSGDHGGALWTQRQVQVRSFRGGALVRHGPGYGPRLRGR
jgi:hypothetical protein